MVNEALQQARIKNVAIQKFVTEWAELTQPDQITLVSAADDTKLLAEAVQADELLSAGEGNYFARPDSFVPNSVVSSSIRPTLVTYCWD